MDYSIKLSLLPSIISTDSLFYDIRDKYQYEQCHIKNFINIPYSYFLENKHDLPKNKPIYIICDNGIIAKKEVLDLRKKNYQAFYIEGGMNAVLHIPPHKYY